MNGLIIGLIVGIGFLICGGALLFSKKALDWMFKEGGWKAGPFHTEEQARRNRRFITGGGLFTMGIIITVWTIIAFFMYI